MKTLVKMFILVAVALSISSAYAQVLVADTNKVSKIVADTNKIKTVSVVDSNAVKKAHVDLAIGNRYIAKSAKTLKDDNDKDILGDDGQPLPMYTIIVVQSADKETIKYYLGKGWKAGCSMSEDDPTIVTLLVAGKKYTATVVWHKDWTFDIELQK